MDTKLRAQGALLLPDTGLKGRPTILKSTLTSLGFQYLQWAMFPFMRPFALVGFIGRLFNDVNSGGVLVSLVSIA